MLAAAFMLTRRQGQSLTTVLFSILPMILLLRAIALIMKAIPVLADDGGWKEAGGTFSSWIHSSGAVMAVTQGIGPAVGTMAGPALGQALAIAGGDTQLWDGGNTPTSSPPVVQDIDIDNATPALLRSSADIGKDNIIQDVDASTLRLQQRCRQRTRRNNVAQDRYEQEEEFSQVQDYALGIGEKLTPKFITQNELFNNWFEWSEKKTLDFGLFSPIRTVLRTEEVITKSSFSPLSGEATPLNQEELKEAKNEMWWGIFENVGIPVAKIGIIGKLFH